MAAFHGSTGMTLASGPQRCASSTVKKPVPAPTSRKVRPGLIGTRSRRRNPKGADQSGNSSYPSPNSTALLSMSWR